MSQGSHRALVVDVDVDVQRLTAAALATHGFACDAADDGSQASKKLTDAVYDVVVVDLKLPNQHGHSLALDLIQRENRPLVVVHTEVMEPKLAQDLIACGIDGVLFKPVDVDVLATKVQSLVAGRQQRTPEGGGTVPSSAVPKAAPSLATTSASRVSATQLKEKLGEVSQVLPISASALDVYEMTNNLEWDLSQIAAAVQRDASLTTAVLRMANSAYYNPSVRPIMELDEAVMRIGQKRVGEMALSINALSTVTPAKIPWMDLELSWNRSMAAGIALELLVDLGGHEQVADGLFVSAIMHPLGRIVLGMLFPVQYSTMVAECGRTGAALQEFERQTFPASHTDVMARLLEDWRLAPEVFMPLNFSLDDYASVARLLEPMRTKAELVKVAIFVGRLAVGRWESWDLVRFPPAIVLDRLHVREVEQLVQQTRLDVSRLAEFHPGGKSAKKPAAEPAHQPSVAYCNYTGHDADLLKEFLPALGVQPQAYTSSDLRQIEEPLVANRLGVDPSQFAAQRLCNISTIFAEKNKCQAFSTYAPAIGLPNGFSHVREELLAHVVERARQPVAGRV